MNRIVVLGIDGVPYSLLTRFIEQGLLPNFARLAEKAPLRQMDSAQPTVSSVAWTSYATGKQPGKHGIYGFIERKPGTYEVKVPLSTSVASKTLWEVLSEAGRRVFVMNVPMTYPPRNVKGALIAGFLCPTIDKVTRSADVREYLKSIEYAIDSDSIQARRSVDFMLSDIHQVLDRRMEAMFHFLQQDSWDYFHTHIMTTDRLHHFLHARFESGDESYADEFVGFYQKIDGYLGRLLDALPPEAGLLVMSDHGFCRIKGEVQLSRYLVEKGWTTRVAAPKGPLDIEATKSRAYCLIPGRLYINVTGREPAGIVQSEDYFRVRDELAKDVAELRAPDGEPVIKEVVRREDLYWPRGENAPRPGMTLDEILPTETAFGRAPDLIAIPFDGYDLKMGLVSKKLFINTELEGMHTFHDALIMARSVELPQDRFAIHTVTRYICRALGVDPPEHMD